MLGALIIDPDSIVDVMARIGPVDFYEAVHRDVFAAMIELYENKRGFDLLTLADKLKDHSPLQNAGGSAYLANLTTCVHTASDAERHASLIKDKAIHRAVVAAGEAITKLGSNEELAATELLDRAEQQILAVSRIGSNVDPETPYEIGKAAYEHYAELHATAAGSVGLRWGFASLDAYLQRLEPGALVILAARPSLGKTSLALNIAHHVASQQQSPVAFFSLEMDKRQLFDRLITSGSGIDVSRLCRGTLSDSEFQKFPPAIEELKGLPLYIDDDPDTSLANLRSKARRIKMQRGLDLLVVDYLQLIEIPERAAGDNRTQQVTYLSRNLKNLARELGCPIIALSQLSRAVEQRNPPIPILSDLRDSGSIEQDADIVLMLYREDVYNEDCSDPGVTDVYIRKNRNGPTGRACLFFDAKRMTFRPLQSVGELPQVTIGAVR